MSSLRRDLFEKHRWPIVLALLIAAVAIPVLLRGHASASADSHVPAAPEAAPVAARSGGPSHGSVKNTGPLHDADRNPFKSSVRQHKSTSIASTTSIPTQAPATSSATASPVATTLAATTSPAVTITRTVTTSAPSSKTLSSATHVIPRATTTHKTVLSRSRTSKHATSGTRSSAAKQQTPLGSWTYYSVSVRMGRAGHPFEHIDIPRFTPLPKASTPRAMFAGVTSGGRSVIFRLAAGVNVHGPGICKPDHARCSAIVLSVGAPEQLTFTDTAGKTRTLVLKATRVQAHVTHSKAIERAALKRRSADGACELQLGDPVQSGGDSGTVTALTHVSGPCRQAKDLVPFPGGVSGS